MVYYQLTTLKIKRRVIFDIDYCEIQSTQREKILAYWSQLWYRLNDLYKGMGKVEYLSDERDQLEVPIGISYTWDDY